ncbi:MAG: DUF3047 domain-containing protein [Thermodesulfobacteriota bacterium]
MNKEFPFELILSGEQHRKINRKFAGRISQWTPYVLCISILIFFPLAFCSLLPAADGDSFLDMGLSSKYYEEGKVPNGWKLRKRFGYPKGARAEWVTEDRIHAVRLHSEAALTFLEKTVNIDTKEFPIVTWKWKVENIFKGNGERTKEGDDHPIRIFFVFKPDESKQSFWFRIKRFVYLDRIHGHPMGGRFTEYLWSSHLQPGDIINDPGKPWQKLMVVEGGSRNLGKWLSHKRNLYEDFKKLYGEEPRRLIFIGILNDTDQTGQEATSYIADLMFHKRNAA